jgi:hypothetical protein
MSYFVTLAVATLALVSLVWWYNRLRADDRMAAIVLRKRGTSMLTSPAHLIDGANHIAVALSLGPAGISYENADLDASIDLGQIDEVEYGSDLVTGGIADGAVLRLRSHGRAYEFVLGVAVAERWSHSLPPHRIDQPGRVEVVGDVLPASS